MIQVVFKDLERSELAKNIATDCVDRVLEKFPDLQGSRISMTLSMQNSPVQAGPDLFTVKFNCVSGKYKGVILERSDSNLYKAMALLSNGLLERLNRFGDKKRGRVQKKARRQRDHAFRISPDHDSKGMDSEKFNLQ